MSKTKSQIKNQKHKTPKIIRFKKLRSSSAYGTRHSKLNKLIFLKFLIGAIFDKIIKGEGTKLNIRKSGQAHIYTYIIIVNSREYGRWLCKLICVFVLLMIIGKCIDKRRKEQTKTTQRRLLGHFCFLGDRSRLFPERLCPVVFFVRWYLPIQFTQ